MNNICPLKLQNTIDQLFEKLQRCHVYWSKFVTLHKPTSFPWNLWMNLPIIWEGKLRNIFFAFIPLIQEQLTLDTSRASNAISANLFSIFLKPLLKLTGQLQAGSERPACVIHWDSYKQWFGHQIFLLMNAFVIQTETCIWNG